MMAWHTTGRAVVVGERPWVERAACHRVADPVAVFFYPSAGRSMDYSEAQAVCQRCPVSDECFEYAVDAGEVIRDSRGWRAVNGVVYAGIVPRKPGRPVSSAERRAG